MLNCKLMEFYKMYNIEEIKEKASLCLNCKVPMCSNKGCPVSTRIPDFISKIK